MTCGACRKNNSENRRYCGGCGANLSRTCTACGFSNAVDDCYCGGCGSCFGAVARLATPQAIAATTPDELRGLFETPTPEPAPLALPPNGIGQDDLDRLFGVDA